MIFMLKIYISTIISVILHECAHALIALILRVTICEMSIGCNILKIKVKKIQLSPLAISGYVEVDQEELYQKGIKGILMFYLSGGITNLLIILISLCMENSLLKYWIIIFNIFNVVGSLLPISRNNDGMLAILSCKEYLKK